MDVNDILGLVSRWLHIIPAILLAGGILFMRFALVPAANESAASAELRESIRRRWSKLVMISVLFLLISGLYNAAMKAIGFELSGMYNALLLIKIVLALAVFYLTAVLSGRSATAQKFRERETYWLNILCALMIAIVLIAGYMKISSANFTKKARPAKETAMQIIGPAILQPTGATTPSTEDDD
jgi:uncharacterized membrane protein